MEGEMARDRPSYGSCHLHSDKAWWKLGGAGEISPHSEFKSGTC